jgi:hypothetical protein
MTEAVLSNPFALLDEDAPAVAAPAKTAPAAADKKAVKPGERT